MSHREQTLQQADPVAAGSLTRILAIGVAVTTTAGAVLVTVLERDQVRVWPFEIAALATLALTGVVANWAASEFRAPLRRSMHSTVLVLCFAAFLLDELAQLGANTAIHDDWGLFALTAYVWVLSMLRPAREILIGGLLVTAGVAVVAVAVSPFVAVPVSALTRSMIGMTAVLPAALGASVFAAVTLRVLLRSTVAATPVAVQPEGLRRSVRDERLAALEADAVPLLSEILADGVLTGDARRRARRIATGLRTALVDELARDWLTEAGVAVDDADGYAARMTPEQRATIRALIDTLPLRDRARPGTARIRGHDHDATLLLRLQLGARPSRNQVRPRMLVLRTVFPRSEVRMSDRSWVLSADFSIDEPAR